MNQSITHRGASPRTGCAQTTRCYKYRGKSSLCLTMIGLVLFGCTSYKEDPLKVATEVETVNNRQATLKNVLLTHAGPLSFAVASDLASEFNPELQAIRSAYKAEEKLGRIKTPWPNPSFAGGVNKASGLENPITSATQPFVALGFSVPLWGKQKLANELRSLESQVNRIDLIAKHRQLYLSLRAAYVSAAIHSQAAPAYQKWEQEMDSIRAWLDALAQAEQQGLSEKSRLKMTIGEVAMGVAEFDALRDDSLAGLAELMGSSIENLKGITFLGMSTNHEVGVPSKEVLRRNLVKHRSSLIKLYADYIVSEKALQAEIRAQYPDIELGGEYEKEPGEDVKISTLEIGIDIPLFDRNQIGIANALAARNQIRSAYQLELNTSFVELDKLYRTYQRNSNKFKVLKKTLIPANAKQLSLATEQFQRGDISLTNYLEYLRQQFDLMRLNIEVSEEYFNSIFALERCVGYPLFKLPSERIPTGMSGKILFSSPSAGNQNKRNINNE